MSSVPGRAEAEDFLYREAALLDAQDWERWLDLFAQDGTYWVPLAADQPDPLDHVSLFYEDRPLMAMRIARLRHPHAHGVARPIRTSRLVGNVRVEAGADGACVVRSRFHLMEFHEDRHRAFAGAYTHRLVAQDGGWRIRQKRVDLVDADAAHEGMQVFL